MTFEVPRVAKIKSQVSGPKKKNKGLRVPYVVTAFHVTTDLWCQHKIFEIMGEKHKDQKHKHGATISGLCMAVWQWRFLSCNLRLWPQAVRENAPNLWGGQSAEGGNKHPEPMGCQNPCTVPTLPWFHFCLL